MTGPNTPEEVDERHLRLRADFENFRRRPAKDHESAHREGRRREAGAVPIDAVGQPFDPSVHEAVATAPADSGVAPGTVVRQVRRGWRLADELLRPAQVTVATTREPAEQWR